eukprot:TRINITY_DN12133_c0_g3_i1.p1 TRINITY_DN12133_c0_g3~~TRINITY_DN12133_c0_g3_i1.p1  ORF type:complete len:292 (+),score=51.54 TRINITY_DN12133_c0_g3_i1:247-1122(+)
MSGLFSRRRSQQKEGTLHKPPSSSRLTNQASPQTSDMSHYPSSSASPQHKTRRATIFDNLFYPVSTKSSSRDGQPAQLTEQDQLILGAAKKRKVFTLTPVNHHLDLQRGDKNELDYLLDKYQPEFEQIVPSLCDALNAVIVSHTLASRRRSVMSEENRFISYDTSTVPEIQLEDYMWRICDYTYISPTTLLMACIYIDRLIGEGLILSQLNVFKLFFTSVRVASKVHELRSLSNKNFAVVGGVTTDQMNQLESLFMRDFKWKLWVEHDTFVQYCQRLAPPGEETVLPIVGK